MVLCFKRAQQGVPAEQDPQGVRAYIGYIGVFVCFLQKGRRGGGGSVPTLAGVKAH